MKKTIASTLFTLCYFLRHGKYDKSLTEWVTDVTCSEPVRNMPGNAWRWAE